MIINNALQKVQRYNQLCVHYNLVADSIYRVRNEDDNVFGTRFLPFLVAALIVFDLGRMMGSGAEMRYDPSNAGFAARLTEKLQAIQQYLQHLTNARLCNINIAEERENILNAYYLLSAGGSNSLNQKGDEFHVGATKIMHFLCPELFVIIDSNTAKAFRIAHNVGFRNTTQPGYTADNYIKCLSCAQADIREMGATKFCILENDTPMARIYDKLSFVTGANWLQQSR